MTKEEIPTANKNKLKKISLLIDAEEWYDELKNIAMDIVYYLLIEKSETFDDIETLAKAVNSLLKDVSEILKYHTFPIEIEAILGIALLRRYIFINCPKVDKKLYNELLKEFKEQLPEDFKELMNDVKYNSTALYRALSGKYFNRFTR